MLEKLLGGVVAVGGAWPLIASSHSIHQHAKNTAVMDLAETIHKSDGWKPLFLDARQVESLTEVAEIMVPGSTEARVTRFIDLLLSVDRSENQKKFALALSSKENLAQDRFARGFPRLNADQQTQVLTSASTDAVASEDFNHLKDWIVSAYYSSEDGMRELGWDGKHAFARFPGCEHDSAEHAAPH